jgi:hypothetical protein
MVKKYGFKFEAGKLVEPGSTTPAVNAASGGSKSKKRAKAVGKKQKAAEVEKESHTGSADDNGDVKEEA